MHTQSRSHFTQQNVHNSVKKSTKTWPRADRTNSRKPETTQSNQVYHIYRHQLDLKVYMSVSEF